MTENLLLKEPPMLVQPTLAEMLGLNNAVALQQLHFLLVVAEKGGAKHKFIDGHWWVYNSYPDWRKNEFRWWSVDTIKRIFTELQKMRLVVARVIGRGRRKWYRIDYQAFENCIGWWKRFDSPNHTDSNYQKFLEQWLYPEPDGTSPWMIENQRGIAPGEDWWKVGADCTGSDEQNPLQIAPGSEHESAQVAPTHPAQVAPTHPVQIAPTHPVQIAPGSEQGVGASCPDPITETTTPENLVSENRFTETTTTTEVVVVVSVFSLWENAFGKRATDRLLETPILREELQALVDDFGIDRLEEAIRVTALAEPQSPVRYCRGVLENWGKPNGNSKNNYTSGKFKDWINS